MVRRRTLWSAARAGGCHRAPRGKPGPGRPNALVVPMRKNAPEHGPRRTPMKLATFDSGQGPRLGAVIDDDRSLVDLGRAFHRRHGHTEPALDSMLALIDAGEAGRAAADAVVADPPEEDLTAMS